MRFVRVRNGAGHEFSEPEGSPLVRKGLLKVVDRKAASSIPLPPKFKKSLPPVGGESKEA